MYSQEKQKNYFSTLIMNSDFMAIVKQIDTLNKNTMYQYISSRNSISFYKYRKVIVIPYTINLQNEMKFLTCFAKKYKEWTFVCGTVEENELYTEAASRELYEETKKLVYVPAIDFENTLNFSYNNLHEGVMYRCHVFFVNISKFVHCENSFCETFKTTYLHGYEFNENIFIRFSSHYGLCSIENMWCIISELVRSNVFYNIVEV